MKVVFFHTFFELSWLSSNSIILAAKQTFAIDVQEWCYLNEQVYVPRKYSQKILKMYLKNLYYKNFWFELMAIVVILVPMFDYRILQYHESENRCEERVGS